MLVGLFLLSSDFAASWIPCSFGFCFGFFFLLSHRVSRAILASDAFGDSRHVVEMEMRRKLLNEEGCMGDSLYCSLWWSIKVRAIVSYIYCPLSGPTQ